MSIKLKTYIETILGPVLQEKNFKFDPSRSRAGISGFVYSRGEPEPSMEWHLEYRKGNIKELPKREEVIIYRHKSPPRMTVDLRSFIKPPGGINLGELIGLKTQKWWPASTVEEVEKSLNEILCLLNDYGWNWFDQPEPK